MANPQEIAQQVAKLLAGQIVLEEFEDWSASYSWNIHKRADRRTQDLAYLVESLLVEFGEGDIDQGELRGQLGEAIRPFVVEFVVASQSASMVPEHFREQVHSAAGYQVEEAQLRCA